jgi:small subunit ribosomal protein S1
VVVGRITKVVTFGAFAEILSGVEGLIHISELADHHVENPRDVVNQGDEVNVKVIEIDPERRRLSLSLKRVEVGDTVKRIEMDGTTTALAESVPELGLSSEVFADVEAEGEPVAEGDEPEARAVEPEPEPEVPADDGAEVTAEPEAEAEPEPEVAAEPEAEAPAEAEPEAEVAAEAEPEAAAEPEAEPESEPEQPAEETAAEPEEALAEE